MHASPLLFSFLLFSTLLFSSSLVFSPSGTASVDLDTHGREEERVLDGAEAPGGPAHRGAAEGRVHHDPDMVPPTLLEVEVSASLSKICSILGNKHTFF